MKHEDLPQRWKDKLQEWLISQGIHHRQKLDAHHFDSETVAKIEFEDGSYAEFHYPLVIAAPELSEVGVFTEHCGYHIFSLGGATVVVKPKIQ